MRGMVLVLAAAVFAAGCSSAKKDPPPPSNPLVGLIRSVNSETVVVMHSEQPYSFVLGDPSVPVSHLEEHRDQKQPVSVMWEREKGRYVAVRVSDA